MRKHILPILLLGMAATAFGAVTLPKGSYSENFRDITSADGMLPDGWTTYGAGKAVDTQFQEFFGSEGEAPYYRVLTLEGRTAAWSCSTFLYAESADEWLVTPPVKIDSDSEVLQLKALSYGAFATNKYRVLISEDGQDRDSFRAAPILNTTLTGWETEVREKESYVALNGYAGKEICLAFVNRGEDAGMLGFTDITIAPYTMEVADLTPTVLPAGTKTDIVMNVNLRTPSSVAGMTAVLTAGDHTETRHYDQSITLNGTRIPVTFEQIEVPLGGLAYTVTLTPDFEGAEPTVVTGEIGTPTTSYPPVVVIEEFTGTWCTYCPRGAAFMEYYADTFDGRDGRGRTIGIALHAVNDPMMIEGGEYISAAMAAAGAGGYPSAFFSRTTKGDPSDSFIVDEQLAVRSNSRIGINEVSYTPGSPVKVSYEVENSYSRSDVNQRVAIVIIENNVKGDDGAYNQTNGLSGVSQQAVEATYGVALWPYFKFFSESPSIVPYPLMTYNHVARGIWPDYAGRLLTGGCEAEVPVPGEMTVEMPASVMDPDNTAVIALLIDGDTGRILSADEVEAERYNIDLSGVAAPAAEDCGWWIAGGMLTVDTPSGAVAEVYAADGRLLLRRPLSTGRSEMSLEGLGGLVIVKVTENDGTVSSRRFML